MAFAHAFFIFSNLNAVRTVVFPSPARTFVSRSEPKPTRYTETPFFTHSESDVSRRPSVSSPSVNTKIVFA